jgi:hypothetical protein
MISLARDIENWCWTAFLVNHGMAIKNGNFNCYLWFNVCQESNFGDINGYMYQKSCAPHYFGLLESTVICSAPVRVTCVQSRVLYTTFGYRCLNTTSYLLFMSKVVRSTPL